MARSVDQIKREIEEVINKDATLKNILLPTNPIIKNGESMLQWMKIATDESDFSSRNFGTKQLYFLVVKVYTSDESSLINTALKSETAALIFSKRGHIKIGGTVLRNDAASVIDGSGRYSTTTLSDSHANTDFRDLVSPYLTSDLYGYSESIVFNADLTYILYKLSTGNYVLLYNPVHRKNFKKLYKLLHEYGSQLDSYGYGLTETVKIGNFDFSWRNFVRRYCNAFVVDSRNKNKGLGAKSSKGRIYADPFCAIMIDNKHAMINSYFASNIVEKFYYESYWPKDSTRDEIIRMIEELTRTNAMSWGCSKSPTPISSYSFIREMTGTESFIEYLAKININGHENPNVKINNLDTENPVCSKNTVIQCVIAAISAGDIRDTTMSCPEGIPNDMSRIIAASKTKIGSGSGNTSGNNTGNTSGNNTGNTSGNNTGNTSGNNTGNTSGNNTGNTSGNNTGYTSWNNTGYTSGNNTGYTSGNNTGYTSGNNTGNNYSNYDDDDDKKNKWKPMYTYIVIAVVLLLVIFLMYMALFKSSSTSPSVETPLMNFF